MSNPTSPQALHVGIIGLGSMGMGAALNLVKAGHVVCGAELREGARADLIAAGGQAVAREADQPAGLHALVVFVVNAIQVDDVLFGDHGCLDRLAPNAVVLCCTTVAPECARNRPHTSNDNPFSESHFKSLKYQPRFPQRFGCIEDAWASAARSSTGTTRTITMPA